MPAQLDPQYALWLDLYPGLKALPALVRELISQGPGAPQEPAQPVDLEPLIERLEAALAGLSRPAPAVDLEPLAERLDALVELGKKSKVPAGMLSAVGGRAATITNADGHEAAVKNGSPDGSEYALLVRPIGSAATSAPVTLTSRMLAKQPQAGWQLWLDTSDSSYIYTLEAVSGTAAGGTGFQGIRIPLDANGNIVGEVQQNTGVTLTWNNRKTDGAWS